MKLHASVIAALLFSPLAFAEEKKPEPAKAAEPAAPATPAAEKIFSPTALEELKTVKGKVVTVEGPIVVQGETDWRKFVVKFK